MKTKLLLMLLMVVALSVTVGANNSIYIENHSFETPDVGGGSWSYAAFDPNDGWDVIAGSAGVWEPGSGWGGYPEGSSGDEIPDGEQVGFMDEGSELIQVLTATLTADTDYVLSVPLGNNYYYNSPGTVYLIELRAGGTPLVSFSRDIESTIPHDEFETKNLKYKYDPADAALVGQPLEISLAVPDSSIRCELDFDDIKLATGNFACCPDPEHEVMIVPPYPPESAATGDEVILSWTNADPNHPPISSVWVDVWFGTGTEPNRLPPYNEYTKVIDAVQDATSVTVTAPAEEEYCWQVDSYIYGNPSVVDYDINGDDPNKYPILEGEVWTFKSISDAPPSVTIHTPSTITWSAQAVQLDATVEDDGISDLSFAWKAYPDAGLDFDPNKFVVEPIVTITDPPVRAVPIVNAGFEHPGLADGGSAWMWSVVDYPEWGWGYFNCSGYIGIYNPGAGYYAGNAPEGRNFGYAYPYDGVVGGFAQILTETLAAETTYTLTVEVGNTPGYYWGGYKVQLLAGGTQNHDESGWADSVTGGTILAQDDNSLTIAENSFETSTVTHTSGGAGSDPNVGLPIQIRLLAIGLNDTYETDFDDVKLTANLDDLGETFVPVTLTLEAHDEGNPEPVSDTVEIDVYKNACTAAIGKLKLDYPAADLSWIEGDCSSGADLEDFAEIATIWQAEGGTILDDIVVMAILWLDGTDPLTAPVPKP